MSSTWSIPKYDRSEFNHWVTESNGYSSRENALDRASISATIKYDGELFSGYWCDPYDNKKSCTNNPRDMDVDHIVPLSDAWASGAWMWFGGMRETFANDPENLWVVSARYNRQKGDKSPDEWMPPNRVIWCEYLTKWKNIKAKYKLSMTPKEKQFLKYKLSKCNV